MKVGDLVYYRRKRVTIERIIGHFNQPLAVVRGRDGQAMIIPLEELTTHPAGSPFQRRSR
jgi:hypothetical protein